MSDFKSSVKFLIHRNKIFNYLKKINIDSLEGTFEETIQHLDNIKTNIYSFLKLLGYYDIIMTFNEFNTIFLIKFHNDVIISYETENSENVLNSVNKLVSCMKNFDIYDNLCVLKIINRFKRFLYEFRKWKIIDKIELVKNLASEYYRLENIIVKINIKPENELYINELEKIKDMENKKTFILDEIRTMNGMEIFNNLKPVEIEYSKTSINEIKKIIQEQYWKMLQLDLKSFPIKSDLLISLLEEIKEIIYVILNKRIDLLKEFEKKINIKQLKKEFDTHYLLDGLYYLLETLKKLQSPEYDDITDNNHKILKHHMIEGSPLYEFIPDIVKYILNGFYTVLMEKNEAITNYHKWLQKKKTEKK